jgi:hypothetical protein
MEIFAPRHAVRPVVVGLPGICAEQVEERYPFGSECGRTQEFPECAATGVPEAPEDARRQQELRRTPRTRRALQLLAEEPMDDEPAEDERQNDDEGARYVEIDREERSMEDGDSETADECEGDIRRAAQDEDDPCT